VLPTGNVTEKQFASYLELFHTTLQTTAAQYLSEDAAQALRHLSFLPAKVKGFVSTQFGVGWEYLPGSGEVNVELGSPRIEDLVLGRPNALVRQFSKRAPAFMIGGFATLTRVEFRNEPCPLRLGGPRAHVRLERCHFDALGWTRDIIGAELFGNRLASFWTPEAAVARAKDEVLAGLVEVNRAALHNISIAEYARSRKKKTVLVLGDYSASGLERLDAIGACLGDLGYDPLLVKEVPDIFGTDLQQKVVILGSLARFTVIDDSAPSGHLTEVQIAQQNRWITVLFRSDGKSSSWMTAGLSATSTVLLEQEFSLRAPCEGVRAAVAWAESRLKELQQKYDELYPWRFK